MSSIFQNCSYFAELTEPQFEAYFSPISRGVSLISCTIYTHKQEVIACKTFLFIQVFFWPGYVIIPMLSLNLTSCDEIFRLKQSNGCRKKCCYKM